MEEIIKKIESYNILNYLLPGIIYILLAKYYIGIDIYHDNVILMTFIYYFIGLIISRIASIVVYPVLEKWKIITFSQHLY